MHPTLIDTNLLGLIIYLSSYRFFMILAMTVAVIGSYWLIKKSELNLRRSLIILITTIIAFLLGARLLNIIVNINLYLDNPARIWSLNATGFSEYGGIICAVMIGWLAARRLKLDIWRLGDLLAPNLGLAIAVMRIGCFLNGCCFGTPTNLPWGIKFPIFSDAHLHQLSTGQATIFGSIPVHPTQIYELLAALIGSAIAILILKKKLQTGVAVLAFMIWFTAFRLFNHFLRVLPADFSAPGWFYPLLYLIIISLCIILLFRRLKKTK